MKNTKENDTGRITDFLFQRMENLHFASIVLLDIVKNLEACEVLEERIELVRERDKLLKSIVNLSSMEV